MAEKEIAIKVTGVGKTFQPQSSSRTIKEAFISIGRKIAGKRKLVHYQGEYTALKDISFEVNKGDFLGIVGRNGCGKSTLLKILAGVYTPTKGTVQVNGKLTPFIELGVGFNPDLSGRDNVFLNGALLGFTREQMEDMYNDIVNFAELHDFMETKLKNYSSGMQVRLAFSVAIRAESDILLIDEVLAVGDAAFQQKCYDYFVRLKENNKTVVFVTHDMSAVNRFCNKAIYIKDSEIIRNGDPVDISDLYVKENMQANIIDEDYEDVDAKSDESSVGDGSTIGLKSLKKEGDKYTILLQAHCGGEYEYYLGLAVLKDGYSIAEINTLNHRVSINRNNQFIEYELDAGIFNPGKYEISYTLFDKSNRSVAAVGDSRIPIQIKGYDESRGAAMKLESKWDIR